MTTLRQLAVACPQCGHLTLLVSDHLPSEAVVFCVLCGRDMGEWRVLAASAIAVEVQEEKAAPSGSGVTSAEARSAGEGGRSDSGETP
jgi:hypothetical protein